MSPKNLIKTCKLHAITKPKLQNQGYISESFIETWERSKKMENMDGKVIIFPLNFKVKCSELRKDED